MMRTPITVSAEDAEEREQRRQQRHHRDHRQRLRRDDVVDRIDRHHAQPVELLGDHHRADLGRGRRAGASGDQQRRKHRPQLANEAEADDGAERVGGAEADQRVVALQPEHRADRDAAQADDDQRQHAELEQLVDEAADAQRRSHHRAARCWPPKRASRPSSSTKRRLAQPRF